MSLFDGDRFADKFFALAAGFLVSLSAKLEVEGALRGDKLTLSSHGFVATLPGLRVDFGRSCGGASEGASNIGDG